ncbi:MAG: hypothetical protein KJO54_13275 [Gammaproteobacteria bacterium]|nr:hypothetical protein [Gammaproteobacteria bacterium]
MATRNSRFSGLRICLLTCQELDAKHYPEDDWPCDPRPHLPEADWSLVTLEEKRTAARTVRSLVESDEYDVFFNMCDASAEEDEPGIGVVRALERLGVPFTGAASNCFEPTRRQMKRACHELGLTTPRHVFARKKADLKRAAEKLRFPMIVKHHNSYASVGLSRASKVQTPAGLRRQAKKIMSRYGAALIEEYIDGIECTVLVAENPGKPDEPITYPAMQYGFPEGDSFKHEALKWEDFDGLTCFPVKDRNLGQRMRDESAQFFRHFDAAGFARCDIRVDRNGTPYMLEINPNCGIYYPDDALASADLCIMQHSAGHAGFTRRLVRAALVRHT